MWPHRRQPIRLFCPWDSPGKNTGVGCHFLLQCMHACMLSHFSRVQLCATLWITAHQAPLSMGFSRQEYWHGLPFPSPLYHTYPPFKNIAHLFEGIWEYLRTGHGKTDWFQIGKGVHQACILSSCLFNLYTEYIMRNTGLEEAQAGIKIDCWEKYQ